MANLIIPPRDLPAATQVFPGDALVVDNGSTVSKATPAQIVNAGRPFATTQEAEAGTVSGKTMTPLTTAAAIAARTAAAVETAVAKLVFPNYADALAGAPDTSSSIGVIAALVGGIEVRWQRDPLGTALGGGWSPALEATVEHYDGDIAEAFSIATDLQVTRNYSAPALTVPAASYIRGRATITRTVTGNLLGGASTGAMIEGLRLNMNRTGLGNLPGHGMSLRGDDITVRDVRVYDYGSDGVGGGSGVLIMPTTGQPFAMRPRLADAHLAADPLSTIGIGWIFDTSRYGFVSNVLVEGAVGGIGYAHEPKNDARFTNMSALTAAASKVALAYGQESGFAPSFNLASGLLSAECDTAIVTGTNATGNLFNGVLSKESGSPGTSPTSRTVQMTGAGATQNAIFAMASHGAPDEVIYLNIPQTFAQVASYDTSPLIAVFAADATKSVIDIVHPGARASIFGAISDLSGQSTKGATANVVSSNGTREYLGSISGSFTYRLTASGATFFGTHNWRFEDATGVYLAGGTDGAVGSNFGLVHNIPGTARTGGITHAIAAGSQAWVFRTGNADVAEITQTDIRPWVTNVYDLGTSARRFRDLFCRRLRPGAGVVIWESGAGSPEGVISAVVGSMWTREDGGPGTTLYIKESGTGTTGWVAK